MAIIPLEDGLLLATTLFAIGFAGLIVRRNIMYALLSVEIMLNAAGWPSSSRDHAGGSLTAK